MPILPQVMPVGSLLVLILGADLHATTNTGVSDHPQNLAIKNESKVFLASFYMFG
jgi:hypothetical protein